LKYAILFFLLQLHYIALALENSFDACQQDATLDEFKLPRQHIWKDWLVGLMGQKPSFSATSNDFRSDP
jgi:hypothetical protein